MKFDEILTYLGAFGPYQRRVYFLLCLISIPGAWHKLAQVFFAGESEFWCANAMLNETELSQQNAPTWNQDVKNGPDGSIGTCFVYNRTGVEQMTNITAEGDLHPCDSGWEFEHTQYQSTIIEDVSF